MPCFLTTKKLGEEDSTLSLSSTRDHVWIFQHQWVNDEDTDEETDGDTDEGGEVEGKSSPNSTLPTASMISRWLHNSDLEGDSYMLGRRVRQLCIHKSTQYRTAFPRPKLCDYANV